MTPVIEVPEDAPLDDLIEAARIVVDNGRQGSTCCYKGTTSHQIGSNWCCALCGLHRALRPYSD